MNKLYYLKMEIEELKKEIRNLAELSSVEYGFTKGSGGVSNPTEQFFMKKQKLVEKLNDKLEKYIDELTRVESIIDGIEDDEIRLIARLRFVDNLKWDKIAIKVHSDRSVCYRKLKKYLKNRKVTRNEIK